MFPPGNLPGCSCFRKPVMLPAHNKSVDFGMLRIKVIRHKNADHLDIEIIGKIMVMARSWMGTAWISHGFSVSRPHEVRYRSAFSMPSDHKIWRMCSIA